MSPAHIRLDRCDIVTVKADVCICGIHRSRDMKKFPISRHLSKACGERVQRTLLQKDSKELEMGQVEVIDLEPGELHHFKCLMFICLRTYTEGNEQYLQQSLQECLETATVLGHSTVAVPALGTGGLNYPAIKVAQATVDAVFLHNIQYKETSSVQTVNIVLLDDDMELIKTYLRICTSGSANLTDADNNEIDENQQATEARSSCRSSGAAANQTGVSGASPESYHSYNTGTQRNAQSQSQALSIQSRPAQGSLLSRLFGLFFKQGLTYQVGLLTFSVRPSFRPNTIGADFYFGIDVSFLSNFIPPALQNFFQDLRGNSNR